MQHPPPAVVERRLAYARLKNDSSMALELTAQLYHFSLYWRGQLHTDYNVLGSGDGGGRWGLLDWKYA